MSSYRKRGASRAPALLCGLSASLAISVVQAQDKPAEEKTMEEVIVTGSRIARPNLESSVPVTTVTGEELFQTGSTSVGDLLNDLPAGTDPCGENGEFHSFAFAGPMFHHPIRHRLGDVVDRDGFTFADVLPEPNRLSH